MRAIDISQPVGRDTAVWPGDAPVSLEWTLRRERGDSVNVAAVSLSVHAGTHADGPLHVSDEGMPAAQLPLEPFLGPARVVDATGCEVVDARVLDAIPPGTERVLFRTRTRVDPGRFPEHFAPLAPALARALVERGVRLVGTDAPSVDPVDSMELEVHRILAGGAVVHLENLVLDGVEPGPYWLVAVPLRLLEADSAPVRAVLLQTGAVEENEVGGPA